MATSQGGGTNENSAPIEIKDGVCPENEIDLIDYFRVLWKRKYFIFLATVLPTLIAVITLFLWPKSYKVTYVYDVRDGVRDGVRDDIGGWNLNEKNYDVSLSRFYSQENLTKLYDVSGWNLNEKNYGVLLNRFYSEDNLTKLMDKFQKNGLEKYAGQLSSDDQSREFVKFEATPPFLNLSKLTVTDPEQINKIREMEALLLNVTITGKSMQDMYKLSSVVRDNIENTLPLYMAQEQLSTSVRGYNNKLAEIENNRFSLELALKNNDGVLAGLKNVNIGGLDNRPSNIVLQFDIGGQSQYLPLGYQIQAAESKKVELEENIKIKEENYRYYKDLLDLNNKILAELGNKLPSGYTTEQFKSFLISLVAGYEKPQLKDYLNSYIRATENRIAASRPITEKPKIYPIAKGTVKKSGVVFAIAFMVSVFAAFLWEGLEKNRTRIS